jgi:hypothetical protein
VAALLTDLADVGGNVKDGCHIASMGGTWMMLTYGLGSMRDESAELLPFHGGSQGMYLHVACIPLSPDRFRLLANGRGRSLETEG